MLGKKKVKNYKEAEKKYFAAEKEFKRTMKDLDRLKEESADLVAEALDVLRSVRKLPWKYENKLDAIHNMRMRYVESQLGRRSELADAILRKSADLAGELTGRIAEKLPMDKLLKAKDTVADSAKKAAAKAGIEKPAKKADKSEMKLVLKEIDKIQDATDELYIQYGELYKLNTKIEKLLKKQDKLINCRYPRFFGGKKKKIEELISLAEKITEELC